MTCDIYLSFDWILHSLVTVLLYIDIGKKVVARGNIKIVFDVTALY